MEPQILISLDNNGLQDISLVAEDKQSCEKMIATYKKFEPEILNFLRAIRLQTQAAPVGG